MFPTFAKACVADVYTKGAHKYSIYKDINTKEIKLGIDIPMEDLHKYELIDDASDNWRKGLSWMNTIESVERHIEAFKSGEDIDPDLKTYNLANAIWGLATLLEFYKIHPHGDDRPHKYKTIPKIGLDVDEVLADFVGQLMVYFPDLTERPVYWNDPVLKDCFEKIKDEEEFWMSIKPKVDPKELPFEPAAYITARPVPSEVTQRWLDLHGFPRAKVITVAGSKVDAVRESGIDVYVDDSYSNFVDLTRAGLTCFLMTATHNKRYNVGYKRIDNLSDLPCL